jgi:hypothetical protein
MRDMKPSSHLLAGFLCAAILLSPSACPAYAALQGQAPGAQSSAVRRIGAIKSINGQTITLAPDSGTDITVTVQDATHILRVAPGEKTLKNATPIQLQDLQVGDRILAAGVATGDNSLAASTIVVMTHSDVAAHQQQEVLDWQKHGIGGLVSAVDPATGTIKISVTGFGGTKSVAIRTTKDTVIRRYAPDSVKFDDANRSTLQEIHDGDQLRARGERSTDGSEFSAVEIVSGSFRNIAGTVNGVDPAGSTLTVQDLLSKTSLVVKVTPDSQLRQLPSEMAEHIAMRLKGAAARVAGNGTGAPAQDARNTQTPQPASAGGMPPGAGGMGAAGRSGGPPDFQQILNRVPKTTLTDLHKGDAVLIVSTAGGSSNPSTVITLVSGVDPILRAAPSAAAQAMMLAPWSLGGAPADAGNQ